MSAQPMRHHPKCRVRTHICTHNCLAIQKAIDAFNADDRQTRRSHPDSREHYHARWPILATDCDYEVSGFSGVSGKRLG